MQSLSAEAMASTSVMLTETEELKDVPEEQRCLMWALFHKELLEPDAESDACEEAPDDIPDYFRELPGGQRLGDCLGPAEDLSSTGCGREYLHRSLSGSQPDEAAGPTGALPSNGAGGSAHAALESPPTAPQLPQTDAQCIEMLKSAGDDAWNSASDRAKEKMATKYYQKVMVLGSTNPQLVQVLEDIVKPILSEELTRFQRKSVYLKFVGYVCRSRLGMVASLSSRRSLVDSALRLGSKVLATIAGEQAELAWPKADSLEVIQDDIQIEIVKALKEEQGGVQRWKSLMDSCYPEAANSSDPEVTDMVTFWHYLVRKKVTVAGFYEHLRSQWMLDVSARMEKIPLEGSSWL